MKIYILTVMLIVHVNAISLTPTGVPSVKNMSYPEGTPTIGNGTYTWFGIKVYDASIVAEQPSIDNFEETTAFGLKIVYDIDINKDDLIEETSDQWNELSMVKQGNCLDRTKWLDELSNIWPDIQQGDELLHWTDENKRSTFFHNGKYIGNVSDKNFSSCFLAIWLAEDTQAEDLCKNLLNIK